jgi:hypothetical protein
VPGPGEVNRPDHVPTVSGVRRFSAVSVGTTLYMATRDRLTDYRAKRDVRRSAGIEGRIPPDKTDDHA